MISIEKIHADESNVVILKEGQKDNEMSITKVCETLNPLDFPVGEYNLLQPIILIIIKGREHDKIEQLFLLLPKHINNAHVLMANEGHILGAEYAFFHWFGQQIETIFIQVISYEVVLGHVVELGVGNPLRSVVTAVGETC